MRAKSRPTLNASATGSSAYRKRSVREESAVFLFQIAEVNCVGLAFVKLARQHPEYTPADDGTLDHGLDVHTRDGDAVVYRIIKIALGGFGDGVFAVRRPDDDVAIGAEIDGLQLVGIFRIRADQKAGL